MNIIKKRISQLSSPQLLILWLSIMAVFNLIQSAFVPLHFDETYYVLYARFLDWGYFDHPPMTALWVKVGTFMAEYPLLARLTPSVLHPIMFYVFWCCLPLNWRTQRQNIHLFFLLSLSLPLMHMTGMIISPDAPLLFFSAFFILIFIRFSTRKKNSDLLLLGLAMALLAYSKYLGALLVFSALAANWKILYKGRFWIAIVIALLLFLPHLYWQYQHDWVSFVYHLYERSRPFLWEEPVNIILGIAGIFNPFLFPLYIKGVRKLYKSNNITDRVFLFSSIIVLVVSVIASVRGHVQIQWTALASFGYLYTIFKVVENSTSLRKYAYKVGLFSLALFVVVRLSVIFVTPLQKLFRFENPQQAVEMANAFGKLPVIFDGRYSDAAPYIFYSKSEGNCQSNLFSRNSQFHYWNLDESFFNRTVIVLNGQGSDSITLSNHDKIRYFLVHSYIPTHLITARFIFSDHSPLQKSYHTGEILSGNIVIENPYPFDFPLNDSITRIEFYFGKKREYTKVGEILKSENVIPQKGSILLPFSVHFSKDCTDGFLCVCVSRPPLPFWMAGRTSMIEVKH